MRRLILMRHAKSSWKSGAPSDHGRPLNKRGRRDAPAVAAELDRLGWAPELVALSDSARTVETWTRMIPALPAGSEVPQMPARSLYHGGVHDIIEHSREWPCQVRTVLILGHNPGWEHALSWLSGTSHVVTTANAALLEAERADTWAAAFEGSWQLVGLIRPRELATR